MPFCHQPTSPWPYAAQDCLFPLEDPGAAIIAELPAVYRPRHPERTGFYQLFETHFDSYVRSYEERFEPRSGPLRPVVVRSVEEFLECGMDRKNKLQFCRMPRYGSCFRYEVLC